MSAASRLDLLRPRNLGELFGDALGSYLRHPAAFLAIGAAVVVPVHVVVSGLGLGQLSGGYQSKAGAAQLAVSAAELNLVIGPLVTAMVVHALLALADGRAPRTGASILNGLEAFRPVFPAVCLATGGVLLGSFVFFVVGLWLTIRWSFTTQAVVVDGRRGIAALQRSSELVAGSWWRVAAITVLAVAALLVPAGAVYVPLDLLAHSADSSAITLVADVAALTLIAPAYALILTLLYFDLLARHRLPAMVPPVPPPGA